MRPKNGLAVLLEAFKSFERDDLEVKHLFANGKTLSFLAGYGEVNCSHNAFWTANMHQDESLKDFSVKLQTGARIEYADMA